jgi:CRP-like cAMP-binding protein
MQELVMSILESCSLFQEFSPTALHPIAELATVQAYESGAFIFQGGEPARYFYVLEEGRIRLRFSEGGQVAYTLNTPGDFFGWSSLVNQAEYTLSAQCVSRVTVMRLESLRFLEIVESDPRAGLIFYRHLADFIGQRLFRSYKATVSVHGERSSLSYG